MFKHLNAVKLVMLCLMTKYVNNLKLFSAFPKQLFKKFSSHYDYNNLEESFEISLQIQCFTLVEYNNRRVLKFVPYTFSF